MPFAQDQNVIQELPTQCSGKSFSERIHIGCADGASYYPRACSLEDPDEPAPKLRVVVAEQDLFRLV